ncbi:MAG: glycosyl hydrolase [Salinivirgaceae bacterium]
MKILSLIILVPIILIGCKTEAVKEKSEPKKVEKQTYSVAPWAGCMVSAYVFQEDGQHLTNDYQKNIDAFESLIGKEMGSIMWYPTFADAFPKKECKALVEKGYIPHLTWELFLPGEVEYNTMPIDENYYLTDSVLAGKYDAYIKQFATDAKTINGTVFIRFLHEFNGNWYLWSGNKNGRENGGPQKVVAVWKYVVDIFNEVGAENVQWIWNPHGPSIDVSTEAWNDIAQYWPGKNYVDWMGMDAYNWYPRDPWGGDRPFRSFDNCFADLYAQCKQLGDHPIMIAEFGTPEFNHKSTTKADWITDAFEKIKTDYPRIKMFVWFHIDKELDWRVNSSAEALESFKKAMQDDYFIGKTK